MNKQQNEEHIRKTSEKVTEKFKEGNGNKTIQGFEQPIEAGKENFNHSQLTETAVKVWSSDRKFFLKNAKWEGKPTVVSHPENTTRSVKHCRCNICIKK